MQIFKSTPGAKYIFMQYGIAIFTLLLMIGVFSANRGNEDSTALQESGTSASQYFDGGTLRTNMEIHDIPTKLILDGGPGKDGIPALLSPKFTSVSEAGKFAPEGRGILITSGGVSKFYPFSIIVWHEIINDEIGGAPVLVTFCPLCGSAIVFDPVVDGVRTYFGVSGKLYESNLLMYDTTTHSLWSQIIGRAVAGEHTGKMLELFPSQVLSFAEVKKQYPDALVMSRDTGFYRDYDNGPYGDYDINAELFFPVTIDDTRLPAKEIMFIVNWGERSVAFQRSALVKQGSAVVNVGEKTITARHVDGAIFVTDEGGQSIPGYSAMWFSWATHHQKDGILWKG